MRDIKHERRDSEEVTCIDDVTRIEARWCKLYVNKITEDLLRIVYNVRVHQQSKEPIIGIITCFKPNMNVIRNNDKLRSKYDKVIASSRNPMEKIIHKFLHLPTHNGGDIQMLYKVNHSGQTVDLTRDDLFTMSEEQLLQLDPYDQSKETITAYIDALGRFDDPLKLRPYYAKDDRINDPDGWLHEDYLLVNFAEEINEPNLLKYNHRNIKIYNELIDVKYEEMGGREKVTNRYILNEWKASGPAMFGVAYGYNQPIVYKNLCEAFGKKNVDRIWQKYYKFYQDDGLDA